MFGQTQRIDYEKFFIKVPHTDEDCKALKGAFVAFYEPQKTDKAQFDLSEIEFGAPYVIEKISVYYSLCIPHIDMTISKSDDVRAKKIRIKCLKGESSNKKPGFLDMPVYFYEPVVQLERQYLNRKVSINGVPFTITGIALADPNVSFVFTSSDGAEFEELVNDALDYTMEDSLVSVEKPEDEAVLYGETTVVKENNLTRFSYVDNFIAIVIDHNGSEFVFSVKNLSDNTIKIIWDEAAFVGVDGSTSKVIHSGIKYNEREKSQIPSIIVKGSALSDSVTPVNNIVYYASSWHTLPMYKFRQEGNVALMLPLQIKGVNNEYIFVFHRKKVLRHPELHD